MHWICDMTPSPENVFITYPPHLKLQAENLAKEWQFPLVDNPNLILENPQLKVCDHYLELIYPFDTQFQSIFIDFLRGKTQYRCKHGGHNQLLAHAIGLHRKNNKSVCDLTAGLGQDSFVLATLGAKVIMLERSRIIGAMLQDAWRRTQHQALSWQFINMDSFQYLQALQPEQEPQVIYLDPMFPEKKKSALVKKEMQILQKIIGKDSDAPDLLTLALSKAKERVVVKRPRCSEPLIANRRRDVVLSGKSCRFDIYFTFRDAI
jgi:16S rRNA (guanine1516-N2)-methyltransferase